MRKIKADINQKDRIVIVNVTGGHRFYYQPTGSKELIYLFGTEDFSGSVYTYFRDKGRNIDGSGYSLTIREIYNFRNYHNTKLANVINRIPAMVDYVVREYLETEAEYTDKRHRSKKAICRYDHENLDFAA